MKGIFYNSSKSLCSIYETGLMTYNSLILSNKYKLDYTEEHKFKDEYDFAVVNEHMTVNNWITKEMIENYKKPVFCIVTEVGLHSDVILKSPKYYTAYIILDPTISEYNNIYSFQRPLEKYNISNNLNIIDYKNVNIPIIGSFGFATYGKEWNKIIEQVNKEFDEAIIRFNIPKASHVPDYIHNSLVNKINKNIILKPGIKFEMTDINYTKNDLIEWCSKNTINIFFYYRQHIYDAGLAAVTDQAISSGRPLLVSNDNTFRHIHKYIEYYPNITIKEAIEKTYEGVQKMKKDWSSENFKNKFENILNKFISINQ